jgi:hypothetical protein
VAAACRSPEGRVSGGVAVAVAEAEAAALVRRGARCWG